MRTLIAGLVIALVIVVGVAIYFDWMNVSVNRDTAAGTSELKVKFHEDRAKEDLHEAGERIREGAREAGQNIREGVERLKGAETVKGKIESVDRTQGVVTIKPEGGTAVTVHLSDSTRIQVGDRAANRDDLMAGQTVTCKHSAKDGKRVCELLTVDLNK